MFEQDLRTQVEKVSRFVEQQQVRFMEQQGRELHARLPAARELRQRPLQIGIFQFESTGHFAAFPFGLAAVAHQEVDGRFAGQKGIVLPQITKP